MKIGANNSLTMQIGANQGQTMSILINSMTASALGVASLDLPHMLVQLAQLHLLILQQHQFLIQEINLVLTKTDYQVQLIILVQHHKTYHLLNQQLQM